MKPEFWLSNLVAYWLQVGLITALAALMLRVSRVRSPGAVLGYWQALLGICLLLPAFEPWNVAPPAIAGISLGKASFGRMAALDVENPSVFALLAAAIAGGIAIRLIWLAIGYARLCRLRHTACPLDTGHPGIECSRQLAGLKPEVYLSKDIEGPATFGIWRPAVLLPIRWLELDVDRQSAVACHEFLHVRRRDWAFHAAEEITRALLWFHPAIWWLTAEIRLAREQVVDRAAVRFTGARRQYVEALLAFADVNGALQVAAAPAFSQERHLARRIRSILEEVSMKKSRLITSLAGIAVLLAVAGVFAVRVFPLHSRRVHSVSEPGMVAPRVIQKADPAYTESARNAKISGTVVVGVEVFPDGRAHNMRIERSLEPGLDRNALDAISNWRFTPGTKDGKPVPVAATIEVNFRLL
jgi:TonB family protein